MKGNESCLTCRAAGARGDDSVKTKDINWWVKNLKPHKDKLMVINCVRSGQVGVVTTVGRSGVSLLFDGVILEEFYEWSEVDCSEILRRRLSAAGARGDE